MFKEWDKWWLNFYFRVNCLFKKCSLQVREILHVQQKMCVSVLSHQNSPVFCNTHRTGAYQSNPQGENILHHNHFQLLNTTIFPSYVCSKWAYATHLLQKTDKCTSILYETIHTLVSVQLKEMPTDNVLMYSEMFIDLPFSTHNIQTSHDNQEYFIQEERESSSHAQLMHAAQMFLMLVEERKAALKICQINRQRNRARQERLRFFIRGFPAFFCKRFYGIE